MTPFTSRWAGLRRRFSARRFFFTRFNSEPLRTTPISLFEPPASPTHHLTHVALFGYNAGDKLLPVMVRDVISLVLGGVSWRARHVHRVVDDHEVDRMGKLDGVVVGGGGLFLRDTNPNDVSGWQWPCSIEHLKRLTVPLVVFAAGYNRFRGQADFDKTFVENLDALARKAVYVGLRNTGSIEAIREYLAPELWAKVRFQPCPTTLASRLYPGLVDQAWSERSSVPPIALNCAFDRSDLRFGDTGTRSLDQVARAARALGQEHPIEYFAHTAGDEAMLPYLDRHDVRYRLRRLYRMSPQEVLIAYARVQVAIGMRGHAQMIPFGCGRPILSLISHDKLRYFLEDTGLQRYGVEMTDDDLAARLAGLVSGLVADEREVVEAIRGAQQEIWSVTAANVADLGTAIASARSSGPRQVHQ